MYIYIYIYVCIYMYVYIYINENAFIECIEIYFKGRIIVVQVYLTDI